MPAQKRTKNSERSTEPLKATEALKPENLRDQEIFFPEKPQPGNPVALLDAIAAISSPLNTHHVAQAAAQQVVLFSEAEVCTISRWDPQENTVTLWAEYRRGESKASPVAYLPYSASDYPKTEQVLRTGLPIKLHIKDPTLDEGERILMKGLGASALLMIPLEAQGKTIGLIEVFEKQVERDFSVEEIANIRVLAEHAGISLERALLLEEAERRAADLEVIRQASIKLTSSLDQQQVFMAILQSALLLSPDALDAHIFTIQDGEISYGASLWADGKPGPAYKRVRKGGLTARVARSGKTIAIEQVDEHPLFKDSEWVKNGWKGAIISLPLKTGTATVGVMNIAYRNKQEFSEDRLRLLGLLSDQAAIAIYNASLHDFVKHQAVTDPLTLLANRRAFSDRLEEEIRRSKRYEHPFTLVILDINGFKAINDTFGHLVGDKVLQQIAVCLMDSVRDTDFVARYGGDEFALILPETSKEQAAVLINKLNHNLRKWKMPWSETNPLLWMSAASGAASFPEDALVSEELIAAADEVLYSRKNHTQ
ncbi:MAG: diguanylate cyclase [Anaerolineales bacterium]|nr:diguanylate cyclase [Anaerolineales bacterium]